MNLIKDILAGLAALEATIKAALATLATDLKSALAAAAADLKAAQTSATSDVRADVAALSEKVDALRALLTGEEVTDTAQATAASDASAEGGASAAEDQPVDTSSIIPSVITEAEGVTNATGTPHPDAASPAITLVQGAAAVDPQVAAAQ